jgi:hypothetical protein
MLSGAIMACSPSSPLARLVAALETYQKALAGDDRLAIAKAREVLTHAQQQTFGGQGATPLSPVEAVLTALEFSARALAQRLCEVTIALATRPLVAGASPEPSPAAQQSDVRLLEDLLQAISAVERILKQCRQQQWLRRPLS